jgi:putative tryptophan/tyrosine transport system substrate-binding protein
MMRRRKFIAGLGGAVVWPLAARAQQPAVPLVGYLGLASPQGPTAPPAFLEGLAEAGYVVGRNVRIEYRWAETARQLPSMAADLVRLQPAVILAAASASALAAKIATSAIPIVFGIGDDPVKLGLVTSFNHPGGNLTGTTNVNVELEGKRFAMMHAIVPTDKTIAALVDANNPAAERQANDIREAARSLGRNVRILRAANEGEIDAAFKSIVQENLGALFVAADQYFGMRRNQFVTLAAYNAIPAFYSRREFAEAGGLLSYGGDINASTRQEGIYVGRILKGERPGDLPVVQPTKFELIINLKAARTLGLNFPTNILALAGRVIE